MKTKGKTEPGFKSEYQYRNNYTFSGNDFRIQQIRNQNFVVPWQICEIETKKEVIAVDFKF